MNAYANKEKELIIKFLNYHYPTRKTKVAGMFKRVIFVYEKPFLLNNKDSKEALVNELVSIVRKVFAVNTVQSNPIVKSYLNL